MSYLDKIKKKFYRNTFNSSCQAILTAAPVEPDASSGVAVLSQTYHPDLVMYLVAAKTFARHIRPALFVIVDDGLLPEDRSLIREHLRNVTFVDRRSVPNTVCPSGGTWERLLSVADFCEQHYVVQLDSDTVTVRHPVEVARCIERAEAFTLPTRMGKAFVPVAEASVFASQVDSPHVQIEAERALGTIEALRERFYIRGCSGFAGFPRGSITRDKVERFSALMSAALGEERWASWGTEQFTSNYLVANTPAKALLPFSGYPYWEPGMDLTQARLIHFIGDHRFTSRRYADVARGAIGAL